MLTDVENPFIRLGEGGRILLKGSIGRDWKCQHFCLLVVTFPSQAWPMGRSASRAGWEGSHCWTGTGKGMWFPERFPASTWEWSSWKRHGAGSTSLLRNTSNPLPGPNVITALTLLLLQRGKKSFFQLTALLWFLHFKATPSLRPGSHVVWHASLLTRDDSWAHLYQHLSLSLSGGDRNASGNKKNELKDVGFYLDPSFYLFWLMWNILPQMVCSIWQAFSYCQSWANT